MSSDPQFHKGHRKRLAKKFWDNKITNDELLEFALGMVIRGHDVRVPARALMKRFGNLEQVLAATPDALQRVPGIGPQTTECLKIIHRIMVLSISNQLATTPVYQAKETFDSYCRNTLSQLRREEFHIIYLNHDHKVLEDETHSIGTINYSELYPREIILNALKYNAHSICMFHNHPSDTCKFSKEDIKSTKELKYKLNAMDIELYDHLLVAAGMTFSMKNEHIII